MGDDRASPVVGEHAGSPRVVWVHVGQHDRGGRGDTEMSPYRGADPVSVPRPIPHQPERSHQRIGRGTRSSAPAPTVRGRTRPIRSPTCPKAVPPHPEREVRMRPCTQCLVGPVRRCYPSSASLGPSHSAVKHHLANARSKVGAGPRRSSCESCPRGCRSRMTRRGRTRGDLSRDGPGSRDSPRDAVPCGRVVRVEPPLGLPAIAEVEDAHDAGLDPHSVPARAHVAQRAHVVVVAEDVVLAQGEPERAEPREPLEYADRDPPSRRPAGGRPGRATPRPRR